MPLDWRKDTFEDMQKTLSEIGGEALYNVLTDFDRALERSCRQSDVVGVEPSPAPMIKPEFGNLSVTQLPAHEVLRRFNALYGSNTRPRFQISSVAKSSVDYDLQGENVYLEKLEEVPAGVFSPDINTAPGSVLFNFKQHKNKMFMKCADGDYLTFSSITTSRFNKAKVTAFSQKALNGQSIVNQTEVNLCFQ